MGRPPIGEHAMTDAERQRRHRLAAIRARIAAMRKNQADREIANLEARITALRNRLAAIRQAKASKS